MSEEEEEEGPRKKKKKKERTEKTNAKRKSGKPVVARSNRTPFVRLSSLPREYKVALLLVALAVVIPWCKNPLRDDGKKKCPFGFKSSSNVRVETDLPSWHPKLVSYDVEKAKTGKDTSAFGPPMLKKNEI